MADDLLPLPMAPRLTSFRDTPVILDADLAEVFGIETKRLNEIVKRQEARFEGYSFVLTDAEWTALRSQDATSKGRGGTRYPPRAFTEHGVVMAATVLNSDRAVAASRRIIEAFVAIKRAALPAAPAVEGGFLARLRERMEALMQAEVDAATGRTVQGQTQEFITEGLAHLRARLKKSGLENEETEARILRTLAEADEARARADTQREMTTRQRIKNQANALRLMIEAELALSGGEMGTLLAVLRDLGSD
ncbi:MAG: ORF6N domain-containing protein [Gemmobacter sp.]